jgi:hypothetical protein
MAVSFPPADIHLLVHFSKIGFGDQQVKQIMEEAVTRKFVHQDSSSVTSLCGEYRSRRCGQ